MQNQLRTTVCSPAQTERRNCPRCSAGVRRVCRASFQKFVYFWLQTGVHLLSSWSVCSACYGSVMHVFSPLSAQSRLQTGWRWWTMQASKKMVKTPWGVALFIALPWWFLVRTSSGCRVHSATSAVSTSHQHRSAAIPNARVQHVNSLQMSAICTHVHTYLSAEFSTHATRSCDACKVHTINCLYFPSVRNFCGLLTVARPQPSAGFFASGWQGS